MITQHTDRPLSIDASRRKAESYVAHARRANMRAVVVSLVASSLSAFLTGLPSAIGEPLMGTWRVTCMLASLFAVIAAITTGLQAQLRYADRLASATECLGRLRALEVQASLGTLSPEELAKTLAQIVAKYPQYT